MQKFLVMLLGARVNDDVMARPHSFCLLDSASACELFFSCVYSCTIYRYVMGGKNVEDA